MIRIISLSFCHLYLALVSGSKSKLNYFIRTFPGFTYFLDPLEETARNQFIPAIDWGYGCSNNEEQLLSLSTGYGRLAISIFNELSETDFENCREITSELTLPIINQITQYSINEKKPKWLTMLPITEHGFELSK